MFHLSSIAQTDCLIVATESQLNYNKPKVRISKSQSGADDFVATRLRIVATPEKVLPCLFRKLKFQAACKRSLLNVVSA